MRGVAWLHDPRNYLEPGMQTNCYLLGSAVQRFTGHRLERREAVLVGRLSSVVAGLASIVAIFCVGSQLAGPAGGLLAAFFLTTCGLHLAESFWARGQIQNVLLFFTSVFFAQKSRDGKTGSWLAAAGAAAGGAIAMRLSLSLLPMLFCAAISRPNRRRNVLCAAAGLRPDSPSSPVSPGDRRSSGGTSRIREHPAPGEHAANIAQHTLAIAVFTLAGSGLAVFISGIAGLAGLAFRGRHWWSKARAVPAAMIADLLGTKWALLLVPGAVQLSLIATTRLLEPRYVDLLVPILAVLAGDFWRIGCRAAYGGAPAARGGPGLSGRVRRRRPRALLTRPAGPLRPGVPGSGAGGRRPRPLGVRPDIGRRKESLVAIQDAEVLVASDIQTLRYLRQPSGTLFSSAPELQRDLQLRERVAPRVLPAALRRFGHSL